MATWTYLFADLATNTVLGELPLSGVRIAKWLNRAGTLTGETMPLSDRRMSTLDVADWTTPCRRVVYAVRDNRPWSGGIIWTREYDSNRGTVQIGAGDWWTYFDHRKVLPLLTMPPPDYTYIAGRTVSYTATEQNTLVRNLVAFAQSHTGGNILVTPQMSTSAGVSPRDRTYYGYELSDVGEVLRQLTGVIDGPDIAFDVGGFDGAAPTRIMRIGTPRLGQQGSPHVWELGANLVSYRWPSDGTKMATRAFATGDGIDQGALIAAAEDTSRYTAGWPLLEAEQGYTTVADTTVLQSHADADLAAARLPVVLPSLTVRGNVPPRTGEYECGDDARVVIRDPFHRDGIDTLMRIVGLEISPGEGDEQPVLTMSPLLDDAT